MHLQHRKPASSWAACEEVASSGREINLFVCDAAWRAVSSYPEIPMQEVPEPVGTSSLEVHKVDQRAGAPFLQRQAERVGVVHFGKDKNPEDLRAHSSTWRGLLGTFYKGM